VIVAGRGPDRLERARQAGAETVLAAAPGEDLAEMLRRASPGGRGPDVVIEAVGLQDTCEAAVRAVRKGGVVNLFGGCAAGTEIRLDAQRLHYEELTIKATFHHTPASVRTALELLADRRIEAQTFITAEAGLDDLPQILAAMARSGSGLKTAILPD
jgi:L-iditol 2-dehydrogenase